MPKVSEHGNYYEIEVTQKPCTRFVDLVLGEARRLYGEDFNFDTFEIMNHHDGFYDVAFTTSSREEVEKPKENL